MPFKKIGNNKYKGPSGKIFTQKQVALYYASGGKFPEKKKPFDKPRVRKK